MTPGSHPTLMTLDDEATHSYLLSTYYDPAPAEVGGSGGGKFPPLKLPSKERAVICVASIKLRNSPV